MGKCDNKNKLKQWQFDEFNPGGWCHSHPYPIKKKKKKTYHDSP